MKGLAMTLVIVAGFLAVALTLRQPGGHVYSATFSDARGLVAGNDVRVYGAIAGRVRSIALTPDGRAKVEFTLRNGVAHPRADATATVRPVDLLGDNYLALAPGSSDRPEADVIPAARTSNTARLDDVLSTFTPDVQSGLRLLLVESGIALDKRGPDLARVSAALTPAIRSAATVASEVAGQNSAVARVVAAAERSGSQLARSEGRLGPLVESLNTVLQTTGRRVPAVSQTLRGAPDLLARMTRTANGVAQTAHAAQPVATSLEASARPLGPIVQQAPQLLDRARTSATKLTPTVTAMRSLLVRGAPTLRALAAAMPAVRNASPQADQLLAELKPAAPLISKGFFDNFADQAAEPGKQPFDPFADPRRAYWRGAAVFSCESFGVAVKPGCLTDFLASHQATKRNRHTPAVKLPSVEVPAAKLPTVPKLQVPDLPELKVQAAPPSPGEQQLLDFLLGR